MVKKHLSLDLLKPKPKLEIVEQTLQPSSLLVDGTVQLKTQMIDSEKLASGLNGLISEMKGYTRSLESLRWQIQELPQKDHNKNELNEIQGGLEELTIKNLDLERKFAMLIQMLTDNAVLKQEALTKLIQKLDQTP